MENTSFKSGLTGVNVKSVEDTIAEWSVVKSAQTEFPELGSCGNSWLSIDMSSVSCEVMCVMSPCLPGLILQAGLMVLSPDNCQHHQHNRQDRKPQSELQKYILPFALIDYHFHQPSVFECLHLSECDWLHTPLLCPFAELAPRSLRARSGKTHQGSAIG